MTFKKIFAVSLIMLLGRYTEALTMGSQEDQILHCAMLSQRGDNRPVAILNRFFNPVQGGSVVELTNLSGTVTTGSLGAVDIAYDVDISASNRQQNVQAVASLISLNRRDRGTVFARPDREAIQIDMAPVVQTLLNRQSSRLQTSVFESPALVRGDRTYWIECAVHPFDRSQNLSAEQLAMRLSALAGGIQQGQRPAGLPNR